MKLVARQNPRRELHVVLDNSSTPQHARGRRVAQEEPAHPVQLHADERIVAQPGRRLLRYPREAIAARNRIFE